MSTSKKKPTTAKKKTSSKEEPRKVVAEIVDESEEIRSLSDEVDDAIESRRELVAEGLDEDLASTDKKLTALTPSDPVSLYLAEIRKYPLLSREQEFELAKKYYETKDPAAAQALVTANLRFVVKVAAEYSKFGARLIDLVQEGNIGLMHAVKDFNPYKGVRLITYAVWWIRGYIQEYLMKQYSLVKIGTTQNQKKLFYQLQREREALDAMGQSPDIKMIASKMGIPEEEVQAMSQRMSGRGDVSLDQKIGEDSTSSLMALQKSESESPDDQLSRQEELSQLNKAIAALRPSLNEKEKIILEERILNDEPLTLQEIADKYGITREAVRQNEARLMKKIKDQFHS